jgi:hypothetical protein
MKTGDSIVVVLDGGIKSAEVIEMLPDGDVLINRRDYNGDYLAIPRNNAFTVIEWQQVKGETA